MSWKRSRRDCGKVSRIETICKTGKLKVTFLHVRRKISEITGFLNVSKLYQQKIFCNKSGKQMELDMDCILHALRVLRKWCEILRCKFEMIIKTIFAKVKWMHSYHEKRYQVIKTLHDKTYRKIFQNIKYNSIAGPVRYIYLHRLWKASMHCS